MAADSLYITQDLYIRRIVSEARYKRLKDLLLRIGETANDDFRKYDVTNVNKYGWGTNEDANDELHQLLGEQYVVSYPKPSKLITLLLASNRKNSILILDYFAALVQLDILLLTLIERMVEVVNIFCAKWRSILIQ